MISKLARLLICVPSCPQLIFQCKFLSSAFSSTFHHHFMSLSKRRIRTKVKWARTQECMRRKQMHHPMALTALSLTSRAPPGTDTVLSKEDQTYAYVLLYVRLP